MRLDNLVACGRDTLICINTLADIGPRDL